MHEFSLQSPFMYQYSVYTMTVIKSIPSREVKNSDVRRVCTYHQVRLAHIE